MFDLNRLKARLIKRLAPFFDLTAWVLLFVSLIPLALIDPATVVTLVQWTAYGFALAALAVVVSRVLLPQVDLSEWLRLARDGSVSAAVVVVGVVFLLGVLFLGLVLWAKA